MMRTGLSGYSAPARVAAKTPARKAAAKTPARKAAAPKTLVVGKPPVRKAAAPLGRGVTRVVGVKSAPKSAPAAWKAAAKKVPARKTPTKA